jgi:hypothetical protein
MLDITQTTPPWRTWKSRARNNPIAIDLEAASVGGLFHSVALVKSSSVPPRTAES